MTVKFEFVVNLLPNYIQTTRENHTVKNLEKRKVMDQESFSNEGANCKEVIFKPMKGTVMILRPSALTFFFYVKPTN